MVNLFKFHVIRQLYLQLICDVYRGQIIIIISDCDARQTRLKSKKITKK